ncbi:uncharacterized protein [Coffea arabica]|uniref:Uncharacterized protein n=1 Tax=Coffea arabica TaxID=13443 RepID=A0ABM4UBB5_COFAR
MPRNAPKAAQQLHQHLVEVDDAIEENHAFDNIDNNQLQKGLLQRRLRGNCLESLSAKIKHEKRLPRIILGGRFFGILCKEKYDSKNEMNPEGFLHLGHRI